MDSPVFELSYENITFTNSHLILEDSESRSLSEAIQSLFLHEKNKSLVKNGYFEKKRDLIFLAIKALETTKGKRPNFFEKICNQEREGRILSLDSGIYKKNRDVLREALVWELSIFFECDLFVAPSLPLYIYGEEATFQPFLPVSNRGRFILENEKLPFEMDLSDYWILSLFTFLIGHFDLNGENVHYKDGKILLIDNDCSFPAFNCPVFSMGFLHFPLQNVLIDFENGSIPLTGEAYKKVKSRLADWLLKKEDLIEFFNESPLTARENFSQFLDVFWERWDRIFSIEIFENMNLRAFIKTIFPEHFRQIEKAQELASKIIGSRIGPMSSLHLLGPCFSFFKVNEKIKREVDLWKKLNYSY